MNKNTQNLNDIRFKTLACSKLTDEELSKCKYLFDHHYGTWGEGSNRDGKQIIFPQKNYDNYRSLSNTFVALAMLGDEVIGQAFYMRDMQIEGEYISWVLQLVVHKDYRQMGIAKTLLYSIWGFSNDYAWGLATSNALTVQTLEKATLRKAIPTEMKKHYDRILMIRDKIAFAQEGEMIITDTQSVLNSSFPVDREVVNQNLKLYDGEWKLGELPVGYEWLAFTFKNQNFLISKKSYDDMFDNSEKIVRDAYSRMNLSEQSWNKHQKEEVDFIMKQIPMDSVKNVLDFGCGNGRHSLEFANRGYKVTGVDYSENNIQFARKHDTKHQVQFIQADCRKIRLKQKYDLAVCLYDVIGSFAKRSDNKKIIRKLNQHLNNGAYLVISVMNGELTKDMAKHTVGYVSQNPSKLVELPPSKTMQVSGDIFNPDYYLLETRSGVVYRKEQFDNDGELSAEYVIRDKRYRRDEICDMLKQDGFRIVEVRPVRAGKWENTLDVLDHKAKELLIIAQKVPELM